MGRRSASFKFDYSSRNYTIPSQAPPSGFSPLACTGKANEHNLKVEPYLVLVLGNVEYVKLPQQTQVPALSRLSLLIPLHAKESGFVYRNLAFRVFHQQSGQI